MAWAKQIKALLFASVLGIPALLQQPVSTSYGITPYEMAYNIGCKDVELPDSMRYGTEEQLGRHTEEFVQGSYDGYNSCGGDVSPTEEGFQPQPPSEPLYTPQPFQQPMQGGIDWITVCNNLQVALVSSCDILVNPDNSLTIEGERAVGCIRNGILLAGGGSFLLSLPLPLVISALQILEEPTGCGGIVEWGLIGNVNDLDGIISLLT